MKKAPTPILVALVLAACAPAIPSLRLTLPPTPPRASAHVEVCLLLGETKDRFLFSAVAEPSFETWRQGIGSVLIRRPGGEVVVVDPAFGVQIGRDLYRSPLWFQLLMGDGRSKTPLVELLDRAGVEPRSVRRVLLTHAHWDHAGGLPDLPRAKVLLARAELTFVSGLVNYLEHGAMRHHFARAQLVPYDFEGPAYEGFAASHDVFGDGSVVAVPLGGHTPGSVGFFIVTSQRRYLLIGDLAWSMEGIRRPIHKNPVPRLFVDGDVPAVGQALGQLNALMAARPELLLVPAHDLTALERIPACPAAKR